MLRKISLLLISLALAVPVASHAGSSKRSAGKPSASKAAAKPRKGAHGKIAASVEAAAPVAADAPVAATPPTAAAPAVATPTAAPTPALATTPVLATPAAGTSAAPAALAAPAAAPVVSSAVLPAGATNGSAAPAPAAASAAPAARPAEVAAKPADPAKPRATTAEASRPPALDNRGSLEQINNWCAAIGKRLGSVSPAQCRSLELQVGDIKSSRGHSLMVTDLAPAQARQVALHSNNDLTRPARILVIGGIHGDELTSASIVFRWLQWMDQPDAAQHHWRVIPVANPDGLLASPPQRVNGNGVDLNRNFPTPDWENDAHNYWIDKTDRDPRRFPGEMSQSESETRWLLEQIESFQPDVVVSIHAPFGVLDYDGPARQPRRFGHLNLNRLGIYPGSLGNYGGVHKNVPVITIELPNATQMPSAREQRAIWSDMLNWIRRNIVPRTYS